MTETAILRVWSDVMMAADVKQVTFLPCWTYQLHLTASTTLSYCNAFRLELVSQTLSFSGSPTSCLNERSRSPITTNCPRSKLCCSACHKEAFCVPQGSVLGRLLYVLYTAELFSVVAQHQLRLHMYAFDSQVYVTTPAKDASAAVARLFSRHRRHQRLDES